VLGDIEVIVGFVSATPVKLLPSIAGNTLGKTASISLAVPSSLTNSFAVLASANMSDKSLAFVILCSPTILDCYFYYSETGGV
jgi:hypothetical protein